MIRKHFLLLVISIFIQGFSFGQKQHNIWYFGNGAGLSFNSGSPVSICCGKTATVEGSSTICDAAGNLLFYTDGVTIWNKNHAVMTNGTGLSGGNSSTESGLIVPLPGSTTIYYVFTVAETVGAAGLSYSIVDMSLSAGLGSVTVKNTQLQTSMCEKVTGARHSNGTDIWIIAHQYNTSAFYTYQLTSGGVITTPVISNTGIVNTDYIGYLKASPDGKKVASCIQALNTFELYDFNATTGVLSNPLPFATTYTWTYGVEFSPDASRLYVSKYGSSLSEIFQFDLLAGSPAAIVTSSLRIGLPGVQFVGALQLGPDGKIYAALYGSNKLGVITNPNTLGMACNYVDQAITLNFGTCQLGLPNCYPPVFFPTTPPPVALFQSSDTTFCNESGACIDFTDHSTGNPTSWQWHFPGAVPDTSTMQNPTGICYYTPGTYPVTLIVSNASGTDTLNVTPMITFGSGASLPTLTINHDTIFSSHEFSYQWYYNGSPISGATDSFFVATGDGDYNVYITDSIGCSRLATGVLFTATNDFKGEGEISIYPNPVEDQFTVSGLPFTERVSIEVLNALGQKVYSDILDSRQKIVSCKQFSPGIYIVEMTIAHKTYRSKFVKQ